jgi:hypothetical protein
VLSREYVIELSRSKRNRKVEFVTFVLLSAGAGEVNAVAFLDSCFERRGIQSEPEALLFPSMSAVGVVRPDCQASTDWLRKSINRFACRAGLGVGYTGHSLRAGGATDLFVARVPYHIVKKAGRWKSDAALVYYRDDDDVVAAISKAFRKAECLAAGKMGVGFIPASNLCRPHSNFILRPPNQTTLDLKLKGPRIAAMAA